MEPVTANKAEAVPARADHSEPALTCSPVTANKAEAVPAVVVDYAHTPDALAKALQAMREHFNEQPGSKLWCVFGCGGERDQGKRQLMGAIAARYADYLVITDDNPRHEEGAQIVQHILAGLSNPATATVIRDRAQAIAHAITTATPNDVVLIAGKGHETYQEAAGHRHPFADTTQARQVLQQLQQP